MTVICALIGFGEAGEAFAGDAAWTALARAYDLVTDDIATSAAQFARYAATGVHGCVSLADAAKGATLILSLVTADQAVVAAEAASAVIIPGTLFCDMNSVAPDTKRIAARAIERAGGHYVDVAIMAPVHPARLGVPMLLSGPHADDAESALAEAGFANLRVVGDRIGTASSIKMIRSVMVKGIEALTAECISAAQAAGVTDEVLTSLGAEWPARADYNLDRMITHGLRRAAEMDEVVKTLDALGTGSAMARATAGWQRAIGARGVRPVPGGLRDKLARLAA